MKDWFRDNLEFCSDSSHIIGSYDDRKQEYNITLPQTIEPIGYTLLGGSSGITVSFREDVRGWVSFKSFTPENGVSCANNYYTFSDGNLWKHHS